MKFELKGKTIDLERLKINFTPNEQQTEALNRIAEFLINRDDLVFTLSGYAGTGKSSVVKILLKWVRDYFSFFDYQITAPTNRAKYVIEALSGQKSKTIHSILGLLPNVDVEKLDIRELEFVSKRKPEIPIHLLIIDECSMVNDALLTAILEKCRKHGTQVLFIGDKAQLKPVKQMHISNAFNVEQTFELTKVERQKGSNPLGGVLMDVRNNMYATDYAFHLETLLNEKGEGLVCVNKSSVFLEEALAGLQNVSYYGDYLHSRILAFTRDRVDLYNKLIRNKLGFKEEFGKGELIMGLANVGNNNNVDGWINSNDYIIENEVQLSKKTLEDVVVDGYYINFVSTDERTRVNQFVISENNDEQKLYNLACTIEDLRMAAISAKERHIGQRYWRMYYAVKESFLTPKDLVADGRVIIPKSLGYGYAMTTHKSQGGTFNTVFVDTRDINIATNIDVEMRNQLLYVAMSRCTDKAVLFH